MKRKILFVISNIDFSLGFEWLAMYLDKSKFDLHFIFLNNAEPSLVNIIRKLNITVDFISYSGKKDLPITSWKIFKIIRKMKPHTVHTHLFDACMAALPAAKLPGVPQRIYTRHHSTFHHVYHPKMVKYDRFINSLCTDIVSITQNVSDVLINDEHVNPSKITLVHHGFDLSDFNNPSAEIVSRLKKQYNSGNAKPVVGVISRYTEWKGIQFIIPAFQKLLKDFPAAKLILANAKGDYQGEIKKLLQQLPPESYTEIEFEKDVFALYALFDIFVHVPVDSSAEAFGQTYVEALAAKVPSVFTLSGIARDFITDKKNALVVPYKDSSAIYSAMLSLLNNSGLCEQLTMQGADDVNRLFPVTKMIAALEELYES